MSTSGISVMNEVLREKYNRVFDYYDMNKNGVWDKGDYEILKDKITINTAHLDEGKRADMVKILSGWWETENLTERITPRENYLKGIEELFKKNTDKYTEMLTTSRNRVFDCLDADTDGLISLDEFLASRKYEGHYDDDFSRKVFSVLDRNKDNFIDRDEYVSAYLTYLLDPTVGSDYLPLYN